MLSAIYDNATGGMDNFVAAPSGVGYAIPGKFPNFVARSHPAGVTHDQFVSDSSSDSSSVDTDAVGSSMGGGDPSLEAFCNLTAAFMGKADMRVVNYIADTDCSPECTDPMLAQDQIDAVVLYHGVFVRAYAGARRHNVHLPTHSRVHTRMHNPLVLAVAHPLNGSNCVCWHTPAHVDGLHTTNAQRNAQPEKW